MQTGLFVQNHSQPDILSFLTTDSGEKLSNLPMIHRINSPQLNLN